MPERRELRAAEDFIDSAPRYIGELSGVFDPNLDLELTKAGGSDVFEGVRQPAEIRNSEWFPDEVYDTYNESLKTRVLRKADVTRYNPYVKMSVHCHSNEPFNSTIETGWNSRNGGKKRIPK